MLWRDLQIKVSYFKCIKKIDPFFLHSYKSNHYDYVKIVVVVSKTAQLGSQIRPKGVFLLMDV